MNLIQLAIKRPIAVLAAVLMVVLFGVLALTTIPIQLTPDLRKPVLTITTPWLGAAPVEVEREIVNRQEDVLADLDGLRKMTSRSQDGVGEITLEFDVNQNMDRALLLTSNRLDRVRSYPEEADEPSLEMASEEDQPIAWFILTRKPGNDRPIHTYGDFVEDVVKDRLERVAGVARVNVFGGSEQELQVIVEPEKMARYGLTVSDVAATLRVNNASITGGDVEEGKRRYVVRTDAELNTEERVRDVLLRTVEDPVTGRVSRVTAGDIARVTFGHKDPVARIRELGEPALAVNAIRETGANVIRTMEGVRKAITELNASALPRQGLEINQVYDETVYIDSAINLVQQNIYIGGTLAAFVLLLFLRSLGATLVVSLAIPVSIIGSFVAMAALGRSINVISLVGIAFAVGMVVDAAIVVLENVFRLRQQGLSSDEAAHRGARQVWGAVLVSALTTVMVFVPILVMQLEVGQLFRDIAVAISVAVILSLIVSITVIPTLANRLLGGRLAGSRVRLRLPVVDRFAELFTAAIMAFTRRIVRNRLLALGTVAAVAGAALLATYLFLPKLEYLPEGNRNLVFGIILPPPGYNLDTTTEIGKRIEDNVRPYWASETGPESAEGEPPKIRHFFFVSARNRTFVGAVTVDPERVNELIPLLHKPVYEEPGTFGIISQASLFRRAISGGRGIDLDVSGPYLTDVLEVAGRATVLVEQALPLSEGNQLRPIPGLELGAPEVRVIPDRLRLGDNGLSARELAETVDAFNDGLRVTEITHEGDRMDLTLKGPELNVEETQRIANLPVVTRSGLIVPTSSLAHVAVTAGPTEVRHVERERTVTLEIRPADQIPLEAALETLQTRVIDKLRADGMPPGVKMNLSGTADDLTKAWDAMVLNLALAVVIVFLVMAILFESFVYPLIILVSVPVATAGGIAGLTILNLFTFQPLDMLTLLGFVILIGIVVNNAILLVHQTLYQWREEGLSPADAILVATRNRIRPIFMSTLTSVFGMLPLVLFPGAGSELYKGLGSVVIGGLSLSALLTLGLVPPLLTVFMGGRRPAPRAEEVEPAKAAAE